MKSNVLATGYGQDLLDQPIARRSSRPTCMFTGTGRSSSAARRSSKFQADLKKYAGLTGVPDYGDVHRLHHVRHGDHGPPAGGQEPDPSGLRRRHPQLGPVRRRRAHCQPIDLKLTNFGKVAPTSCTWYVTVKDGKFKVLNRASRTPASWWVTRRSSRSTSGEQPTVPVPPRRPARRLEVPNVCAGEGEPVRGSPSSRRDRAGVRRPTRYRRHPSRTTDWSVRTCSRLHWGSELKHRGRLQSSRNAGKACKARIDHEKREGRRQRAQRSTWSRTSTTQSSARTSTATQDLAQNREVFADREQLRRSRSCRTGTCSERACR